MMRSARSRCAAFCTDLDRAIHGCLAAAVVLGVGVASATPAFAQARGRVHCEILENGNPAAGTFRLVKGGKTVAEGACSEPLDVSPGEYEAVLSLDGALDGPEQRQQVRVKRAEETGVRAEFATGTLVVRIRSGKRNAAGMVTIRKNGRTVATLASGVEGHLSAGTYDLEARYRTQKQQLRGVRVGAGDRRELTVSFD